MSSSNFVKYVCVLLFLALAVKVHSQEIRFPSPDNDDRRRVPDDCNCVNIRRCPDLFERDDWRTAGITCGYGNGQRRRVCCPRTQWPPLVPGRPAPRPEPPGETVRPFRPDRPSQPDQTPRPDIPPRGGGSSDCNCITVRRCPVLWDRTDWRTAGQTCGSGSGLRRKVCCPAARPLPTVPVPRPVDTTTPPPVVTTTPPPDDITTPPTPTRPAPPVGVCGVSNYKEDPFKPLIIGGENATEGQWPWMAAIRMRESTGYYGPWCSGFLIDRRHVLSAAHCFHVKSEDRYVARIGSINQNAADEYRITNIAVPAGYKNGQFYDDIAVLTLDREVRFQNFNPICLPNEEVSRMNLNGKGTTVAGWGADKDRGEMKALLQYLHRLPVMSNQLCQRALREKQAGSFQRQFPRGISRGFICAAFKEGNKDACGGDSGGPQMIQSGNRWYAIGIVSFGYKCGVAGMPGGYTRVSNYLDWIKQNTGN